MPHAKIPDRTRANTRRMRHGMTDAERALWNELRAHRLMGLSFRRQMPIAGYIVDFACPDHKLIIEVDGARHGNDADVRYDVIRTARLESDGWRVLRVWNGEPMQNIDAVCDVIVRTIGVENFE
ncbi:MAG: endonuclease domain-containing protein [Rhizobiaceae bacterium]|nr:endonuclease domain-containing protein [Rhizobiaceae bacterium]